MRSHDRDFASVGMAQGSQRQRSRPVGQVTNSGPAGVMMNLVAGLDARIRESGTL